MLEELFDLFGGFLRHGLLLLHKELSEPSQLMLLLQRGSEYCNVSRLCMHRKRALSFER